MITFSAEQEVRLQTVADVAKRCMAMHYNDRTWYVVGGALRDIALNRQYKDIDIFVSGLPTDPMPDCEDTGTRNAFLYRAEVKYINYLGEVYEVNLIFMRGDIWDEESLAERCDFGICQIGWDCRKTVHELYVTNAFLHDVSTGTVTMTRETTTERIERMHSKFPRYHHRNPDGYESDVAGSWVYSRDTGEIVLVV